VEPETTSMQSAGLFNKNHLISSPTEYQDVTPLIFVANLRLLEQQFYSFPCAPAANKTLDYLYKQHW
jgi:hypothetical protein